MLENTEVSPEMIDIWIKNWNVGEYVVEGYK